MLTASRLLASITVALLALAACDAPLEPEPSAESVFGGYVLERVGIHPLPYTAVMGKHGMILLADTLTLSPDSTYRHRRLVRMKTAGCDCFGDPMLQTWGGTYSERRGTLWFVDEWGTDSGSAVVQGDSLVKGSSRYRRLRL